MPITLQACNRAFPQSQNDVDTDVDTVCTGGGRRDRTLYADSPPPPPCWVLAGKCRTMGAEGTLRKFCLT